MYRESMYSVLWKPWKSACQMHRQCSGKRTRIYNPLTTTDRKSHTLQLCRHFLTLDILLTVHLSIIYFSLFPTWYTVFPSTYNICYPLSSTCFRPHRLIIRRSKLYMQPVVLSPSADVFVVWPQRPHDKDICRGGEYHRLHVQFRPPDDGPVRPETCRDPAIYE